MAIQNLCFTKRKQYYLHFILSVGFKFFTHTKQHIYQWQATFSNGVKWQRIFEKEYVEVQVTGYCLSKGTNQSNNSTNHYLLEPLLFPFSLHKNILC
jgi:hypothetical protein